MINTWRKKIFCIWFGQSVSLLTSSVLQMSIIWYLSIETGSAQVVTFSTLCGFMPQAILGTFAGPIIDRLSKKKLIILSDFLIALASLALALVALSGSLPIWFIFIILIIRSIGTAFHEPAAHSLTPLIVPKEFITQYAGYSQAFDSICYLLSPAIALMLYNVWDLSSIIFLDVLGAAVAITILLVIKVPKEELVSVKAEPINIIEDTKLGIKVMKSHKGILTLMFIATIYSAIYSPIGSLYPYITMNYFGGTTTQSGLIELIFAIGTLLGSLLLARIGNKIKKSHGLSVSMLVYGLGVFITGCLSPDGLPVFFVLSFIMGLAVPFYHGITRAIYQLTIEPEYLGRAFSLSISAKRLGMPIGLLLGGYFADAYGINTLCIVVGIMAIMLGLTLYFHKALRVLGDL